LLQDYETNFKDNSKLSFLKSELNKILDIKKEIESNISNLELRIKNLDILEQAELSGSRNIFKRKEVLNYEKYKSFKEDIDKYNISLLE
jgi:hypothetical protein